MIGIGILSFDRPDYVRRLLASLEAQTVRDGYDLHLYQDGAVNAYSGETRAKQSDIEACVRAFANADLPNKWAHIRQSNVNVGINTFEAIEELTGTYERVILLEDDVVLSPYWPRLARVLFDGLAAHPDVFSFSPGFVASGDDLSAVVADWHHMWCECFTADRWQRIRPYYLEFYEQFIAGCDYLHRDEAAILDWQAAHGGRAIASQDGGRETAIRLTGMRRVRCEVNRALGIGQRGLHFTPALYRAGGFQRGVPFIHPSDAEREAFTWH
jgi:hypothetical protein